MKEMRASVFRAHYQLLVNPAGRVFNALGLAVLLENNVNNGD